MKCLSLFNSSTHMIRLFFLVYLMYTKTLYNLFTNYDLNQQFCDVLAFFSNMTPTQTDEVCLKNALYNINMYTTNCTLCNVIVFSYLITEDLHFLYCSFYCFLQVNVQNLLRLCRLCKVFGVIIHQKISFFPFILEISILVVSRLCWS